MTCPRASVRAVPDVVGGDVGDQTLVTQVIAENGVEAIIHLHGSIVAPDSVRGPLSYYFNNTCKSWTLFACLPIAARSRQADDPYRRQADSWHLLSYYSQHADN